EAPADRVLQGLDELPLALQVVNLAEMQANFDQTDERSHAPTLARGRPQDSRVFSTCLVSKNSRTSPSLMSAKPSSTMPHSWPSSTSATSSLKRRSEPPRRPPPPSGDIALDPREGAAPAGPDDRAVANQAGVGVADDLAVGDQTA